MRTLFVGDLHAKADLLPLISRVAQRENTDRMVLLGDVCDDWNVSNNGLIRFFETFTSWYRREAGEREVIPLLGNHDVPYFLKCVCSIESGPCERVDVFHVSGRFWSTSACGEKRTPARPAWTSFPS